MYYRTLPQAPIALVSGISAVANIGTIIDARVGEYGQIFLEVLAVDTLPLTDDQFRRLAEYCETEIECIDWSTVEVGEQKAFVLSIIGTVFNFDHFLAAATPVAGHGDSEESWQAAEALAAARKS